MELGKGKLRRHGMNNLQNAIHEQHGLIWTDGKGIYLAPVQLNRDQKLDNAASLRLGEFDNVQSVHWSCSLEGGGCYMAAVHQPNVTVWHVSGAAPRLAFKQVRKINVQPIPQGCLWNPRSDVLCLLSRQQCSFYFRHTHNRGSFAFPSLENGKISCGCWSPDGKRLVLCVGTALLIYTWADIQANIGDFVPTAWRIPGVSGSITAVVASSSSSVLCASALPLDALCANHHQESPPLPGTQDRESGSHGGTSVRDGLFNLQSASKGEGQDAARLSVVQLRSGVHDPQVVTSALIPALLSPDLLHFQMESQCVVVGSSSQSALQMFAFLDSQLMFAGHLTLEKEERPKGLCGLHVSQSGGTSGVVVLVGKTGPEDSTFPSSDNTAVFPLSLTFFTTKPERPDRCAEKTPSRFIHDGGGHSLCVSCTLPESHRTRGSDCTVCGGREASESQVPAGQWSTAAGSSQTSFWPAHCGTDIGGRAPSSGCQHRRLHPHQIFPQQPAPDHRHPPHLLPTAETSNTEKGDILNLDQSPSLFPTVET